MTLDLKFEVLECSSSNVSETISGAIGYPLFDLATGYFDLPEGIEALVNDIGLMMDLPTVLLFLYQTDDGSVDFGQVVGNVVFTDKDNGDGFKGLTDQEIEDIKKSVLSMPRLFRFLLKDFRVNQCVYLKDQDE